MSTLGWRSPDEPFVTLVMFVRRLAFLYQAQRERVISELSERRKEIGLVSRFFGNEFASQRNISSRERGEADGTAGLHENRSRDAIHFDHRAAAHWRTDVARCADAPLQGDPDEAGRLADELKGVEDQIKQRLDAVDKAQPEFPAVRRQIEDARAQIRGKATQEEERAAAVEAARKGFESI